MCTIDKKEERLVSISDGYSLQCVEKKENGRWLYEFKRCCVDFNLALTFACLEEHYVGHYNLLNEIR